MDDITIIDLFWRRSTKPRGFSSCGADSFKYVPFYIKLTTGKTTPAEDIVNGMTPSEAIRLSDTDSLISEINSLLKKIHEAAADEGDSYRITYKSGIDVTVNNRYLEKLPESSFDIGGGWSALVDTSGGQTQTQIILRNTDGRQISTGTKEITCLNSSAAYKVTLQIPASWLDRGYYSDMEREKAVKHSTSRLICDNVMPTAGLITESGEWNPDALDDTGWYSKASAINYSETDSGLRYMQITIYRLGSDGKYTSYKLAFCKGDRVEFTMEMTSYGDDPEEYYTDVLLPIIMSVEITED